VEHSVQTRYWEGQRQSAYEQESQARQLLHRHQQRLQKSVAERDALLDWLAQLEADDATNLNPVQMRWLVDGGFRGTQNLTYLIEMGYDCLLQ
jgi:hypothetical protein